MESPVDAADRYRQQYFEVIHHLDQGNEAEAVRTAKRNLMDWGLYRFWQIKNCIMIVFAEEDWDEAEKYRLAAEEVYAEIVDLAPLADVHARQHLARLRSDLDEVARNQEEDRPEPEEPEEPEDKDVAGQEEKKEQDALDIVRATVEVRRQLELRDREGPRIDLDSEESSQTSSRTRPPPFMLLGHLDDLTAEDIATLEQEHYAQYDVTEGENDEADDSESNADDSQSNADDSESKSDAALHVALPEESAEEVAAENSHDELAIRLKADPSAEAEPGAESTIQTGWFASVVKAINSNLRMMH